MYCGIANKNINKVQPYVAEITACSDQLKMKLQKVMSHNVQTFKTYFLCLTFPSIDGTVMTLARQLHSGRQLHKLMTKSASKF